MTVLDSILEEKIVVIVRGLSAQEATAAVQAVWEGGLTLAEITFDQQKPVQVTADIIRSLCSQFKGRMHIGAGTVMTMEQLYAARDAGAEFIISPHTDPELIRETKHLGMVSMPGAFTATEVAACRQAGADIVKVFPADSAGPAYLRALQGPLHHIPLSAVGGVTLDNIQQFLEAGACCVGIGGNIIDKKAVAAGDFGVIRELARAYRAKVRP